MTLDDFKKYFKKLFSDYAKSQQTNDLESAFSESNTMPSVKPDYDDSIKEKTETDSYNTETHKQLELAEVPLPMRPTDISYPETNEQAIRDEQQQYEAFEAGQTETEMFPQGESKLEPEIEGKLMNLSFF